MATRPALLVVLLAAAGCHPAVGFSSLSDKALVFAGQRNGERVSGTIFFGSADPFAKGISGGACFSLDPKIEVTLNNGNTLGRGTGPCLPNGIADRWIVPEVRSLESEDLNVVFSDGTNLARAVLPGALTTPQTTLTNLFFRRDEQTQVLLGFPSYDIEVHYVGTDGAEWTAPVPAALLDQVPGSGSGTVTITGIALIEGSSCRGFAACRGEVPFSFRVPATYQ